MTDVRTKHSALCRSCKAEIFWAITADGKRMPVNSAVDPNGGFVLELVKTEEPESGKDMDWLRAEVFAPLLHPNRKRYTSHFATCPDAGQWRKK